MLQSCENGRNCLLNRRWVCIRTKDKHNEKAGGVSFSGTVSLTYVDEKLYWPLILGEYKIQIVEVKRKTTS
ncbi:hypothetical protein SLE2022_294880 [Rubroshorea leprosula]